MSHKKCSHHKDEKKLLAIKIIGGVFSIINALAALVIFIIWAMLKSSKPSFVLHDATLYSFNLTTPTQLTFVFQVTVQAKNPSNKISIYYDKLETYATFQDQRITMPASSPPMYQDTQSVKVWSPLLQGTSQSVPIAPYLCDRINQQINMGNIELLIKIDGRLRYKIGSYTTKKRRIQVRCHVFIPFGNPNSGVNIGENVIKYELVQGCSVIV